MFPPETAAHLFECMLLDVVEIIGAALADLEAAQDASAEDSTAHGASAQGASAEDSTAHGANAQEANAQEASAQAANAQDSSVHDTYEFVISTTPPKNVPVMRELLESAGDWPHDVVLIADEGASFDEHYNHAFQQCWDRGADCILSMGADMPALTKADIKFGFKQLHRLDAMPDGGIVVAPDQEMGVSVVGWTRNTTFDHSGVFYNQDGLTVLPAYIQKAAAMGLPALWMPPIPDVDTMQDFVHNVTLVHSLCYCAEYDDICPPKRTAQAFIEEGFREIRVAPNNLFDPREHIDD